MNGYAEARLRISYLGGGYDFPQFFKKQPLLILSEGTALKVRCEPSGRTGIRWRMPPGLQRGLGSSAARHLSWIRLQHPDTSLRQQIDAAIALEGLQCGGWQDPIASGYEGVIRLRLFHDDWDAVQLQGDGVKALQAARRLYIIPAAATAGSATRGILKGLQHQDNGIESMQQLVHDGLAALSSADIPRLGRIVADAWSLKKQWHPQICTPGIQAMCDDVCDAGAWGWKVCGAGGQGYLLVIADAASHGTLTQQYQEFPIDVVTNRDTQSKRGLVAA